MSKTFLLIGIFMMLVSLWNCVVAGHSKLCR